MAERTCSVADQGRGLRWWTKEGGKADHGRGTSSVANQGRGQRPRKGNKADEGLRGRGGAQGRARALELRRGGERCSRRSESVAPLLQRAGCGASSVASPLAAHHGLPRIRFALT